MGRAGACRPPLREVPLILTDYSSEPYSVRMLRTVARTLAPTCNAVLVGEHQDRPDFPPTLLASMLREAGARPWMTLACRDRNRIVLEEELSGLCHLGVNAVLCVTGDARAYDVRPDVTRVTRPRRAAARRARRVDRDTRGRPGDSRRAAPAPAGVPPGPEAAGRGGGRGAQPQHRVRGRPLM